MQLQVAFVPFLCRGARGIMLLSSALLALDGSSQLASAATVFVGPTPYLSFADSPFTGSFAYFHLEDFEDGALNTPGLSASAGVIQNPGTLTDSVDADDGSINGSGTGGHSWFSSGATSTFSFSFSSALLGAFPTHAGVVWTDVGQSTPITGVTDVRFEAFGPGGASLGKFSALAQGDGLTSPTSPTFDVSACAATKRLLVFPLQIGFV